MYKGTIFIAGIHGVGKSTLCKEIANQLSIKHLTASQIIQKYTDTSLEISTKYVSNIPTNQRILSEGLKNEIIGQRVILLDGHFVLLNDEGTPSMIDISTFERLLLSVIITIVDDPIAISRRLFLRDNVYYEVDLLSKMQTTELQQANAIALNLNIKTITLDLRLHKDPISIFSSLLSTYI